MFEPSSFSTALVMMLAGMVCWGSWPSIYKALRNWPFELFYFDYAAGLFLAAVAIAATLGTLFGHPNFVENLFAASPSSIIYAVISGVVWNFANILLVNGIALVGMSVAFPIAIGLALVFSTVGGYLVMPRGNATLLAAGVALVLVAVLLNSAAYRSSKGESRMVSRKGLWACVVAGLLISTVGPVIGMALSAKPPLSPYGATFLFTLGALASTFPILSVLMRHPLQGAPICGAAYWKGSTGQHAAGLIAGAVWTLGTAFTWIAAGLTGIALAMAIGQANPLVAGLWGVFVWREFRGASRRCRLLLVLMFTVYAAGLLLLALSFDGGRPGRR